jgi:hypothetical protein
VEEKFNAVGLLIADIEELGMKEGALRPEARLRGQAS